MSFRLLLLVLLWGVLSTSLAETSKEYFKEAQAYLQKGQLNAAVIQLKNALKEDPKNAEARLLLGKVYLLRGDGAGAEKEFDRARRLGVAMPELIEPLGHAYLMQGKADKVLSEIRMEEGDPDPVKAQVLIVHANAYLQQDKIEEAEQAFRQALTLQPDAVGALLGLGRIASMKQQLDEAAEMADKALSLDPQSTEAWSIKGEIARLRGDLETANTSFDKALAIQPLNLPALLGSAGVNIALDNMERADKAIDKVLRVSPQHPLANYLRAVSLYRKQDLDAAADALQVVMRSAPKHLASRQMMGAIDFAKGRYEQAERLLLRVVDAQPGNIPAFKLLAATQLKLKQPEAVIKLLEKALPKAPDDAQLLALLGSAYLQDGQAAKGTEYLERAVAAAPDAAGIHTQLALGRLAAGETSKAVKELETAVDLGQNVFQADVVLTMVRLRDKEYDQALAQAQAFAKKLPDNPLPYNLMGVAYLGLEKESLARQQFNQALAKDPSYAPARMNLGRMAEKAGQVAEAEKDYRAILKHQSGHLGAHMALARLAGQKGDEQVMRQHLEAAWEANEAALQPGLALVEYYNRAKQPLRAVSIARELKTVYPDNPVVLSVLGRSQLNADDKHGAKASFEALVKRQPDSPQPHFMLAQALLALDDAKAARREFKQALSLSADYLPAQLALAKLEMQAQRPKAAMAVAKQIQQQRPDEATGYRLQGDIHMKLGEYPAAIKAYDQGFAKVPASPLVVAIYQARDRAGLERPYRPLEEWLKDHPDDAPLRMVLASAYQAAGDFPAAVTAYRQLLKQRPKDLVVLNNLAWALHQLGQPDALKYAEQAYNLAPENPAVIDTYGWLLVEKDNAKRGLVLLQQAVLQAPHIAEIRYHLGVALHRAGRDAEARAELKRALEMSADFSEAGVARALLAELGN